MEKDIELLIEGLKQEVEVVKKRKTSERRTRLLARLYRELRRSLELKASLPE